MQFDLTHTMNLLGRTPAVFGTLLAGLPEPWVTENDGGASWSPFDILGHLIHGERTDWIPRAQIILSDQPDDARRFEPFDRHAQERASEGPSVSALLTTFADLRGKNLRVLAELQLTEEQYDRTGIHPEFGTVTLQELLATWAAHDLGHIAQATRVMAKGYTTAVGPWRAYLPVLSR